MLLSQVRTSTSFMFLGSKGKDAVFSFQRLEEEVTERSLNGSGSFSSGKMVCSTHLKEPIVIFCLTLSKLLRNILYSAPVALFLVPVGGRGVGVDTFAAAGQVLFWIAKGSWLSIYLLNLSGFPSAEKLWEAGRMGKTLGKTTCIAFVLRFVAPAFLLFLFKTGEVCSVDMSDGMVDKLLN